MADEETKGLVKKCLENWGEISKEWPHPCVPTLNNILIFAERKGMTKGIDLSSGAIGRSLTELIKNEEIVISGVSCGGQLCLALSEH